MVLVRECINVTFYPWADGHWGEWDEWGACSATCGSTAVEERSRTCGVPVTGSSGVRVCETEGQGQDTRACTGTVPGTCPGGKSLIKNAA